MPNRILREGIIDSRAVNSLSDAGEIFYRRLMSVVDDYGRIEADLEILRARCFARSLDRWPLSRVSEVLTEVSGVLTDDGHSLLTVYCVSNHNYLQINKFDQRIRAAKSKCPSPDGQVTVICQTSAARARTTTTTTPASTPVPVLPSVYQTEWPLTTAAIREHDLAVNDIFVRRLADATAQRLISAGDMETFDDEDLAFAVRKSYAEYTGRGNHGTGLLLMRVPQILLALGENGNGEQNKAI